MYGGSRQKIYWGAHIIVPHLIIVPLGRRGPEMTEYKNSWLVKYIAFFMKLLRQLWVQPLSLPCRGHTFIVFVTGFQIMLSDTKLTATDTTDIKTPAYLQDPNPVEDVPDQDSVNNQEINISFFDFAYPTNPGCPGPWCCARILLQ